MAAYSDRAIIPNGDDYLKSCEITLKHPFDTAVEGETVFRPPNFYVFVFMISFN